MATTLETVVKNHIKEKGEKPSDEGREDDKKKKEKVKRALLKLIHEYIE